MIELGKANNKAVPMEEDDEMATEAVAFNGLEEIPKCSLRNMVKF